MDDSVSFTSCGQAMVVVFYTSSIQQACLRRLFSLFLSLSFSSGCYKGCPSWLSSRFSSSSSSSSS